MNMESPRSLPLNVFLSGAGMTFTTWTPAFAAVTSFLIVMPAKAGIQVLHDIPVLTGIQ